MRLDTIPDHGDILVVHPDCENLVTQATEFADIDYMLSRFVQRDKVYLLNCDAIFGGRRASDTPEE